MNVCIINDLYIDLSCLYDSRRFAVRKGSNITHLKVKYDAWKKEFKIIM